MKTAIGIIGHAGTGKTTLARALARAIDGADIVSFGDEVRRLAAAEGLDSDDRGVLMKLGQNWVDTDVEGYCQAVLDQRRRDATVLIIEGIRHEVVRSTLKRLLEPTDFACALLKAPYDVLVDRMTSHGTLRTVDVQQVLSHPTETQVDQLLLGAADLILDATDAVSQNVKEVLNWLAARERRASGEKPADYFRRFDPEVFDAGERMELVNAVSTEFDMPLLKEVSERLTSPVEQLLELRESRRFIALDFSGKMLVPGFQMLDNELDQNIAEAVSRLSTDMTSWEIVAWMISNNGRLDGSRPVDLPREQLLDAVRLELEV